MHEFAITESLIEICMAYAGGRTVKTVVIEVGVLAGVVAESIDFCFECCIRGTSLEGARLQIEMVQGAGKCSVCGALSSMQSFLVPCPECGNDAMTLLRGYELRVKELEVTV